MGVQTGGANIQFAVHAQTGERVVIEMNPRVSRSSALASKATGFPIAKIAALLAIGYHLDEIKNDITKTTPSCYEPALDYVVTKIPRFAFEKFQGAKDLLSTQMKSVGEAMSIGRTFKESLMKALLSLEFHKEGIPEIEMSIDRISYPNSNRIFHLFQAFREGKTVEEIEQLTQITPWFLEQIKSIVDFENQLRASTGQLTVDLVKKAKRMGFSDARISKLVNVAEKEILSLRENNKIFPHYLQVDTCAAEFESSTPYFYSSYWPESSAPTPVQKAVVVIGSGPNRIGQGIEFDYSCVRGVKAFQKQGHPVAMVNSNPETVSTDYDTSNILFFEPLTSESLREVMRFLQPLGFVAQLGGQTPINVARSLVESGYKLLGSSLEAIDLSEDRGLFNRICRELDLKIPNSSMSANLEEALAAEKKVGYPMICRPSYVLGGRRMEVIENRDELESYFKGHGEFISADMPCLMDQFLAGALEVDVDLVRGPDWTVIGGIVEHIEAAGVHSGDSMGVLPPQRLKDSTCEKIEVLSRKLADRIGVIGHLNMQLAIKNDQVFILEANPRSSRSVPFVAKATGVPLIDLGVMAMLGVKAQKLPLEKMNWRQTQVVSVKGVVFPFKKFSEADSILGPEMKSTGESMGRGQDYPEALMKAFISSQMHFPLKGEVFFSLREKDKESLLQLAKQLTKLGYTLSGTTGTADFFKKQGLECLALRKVHEGRPHCVDRIRSGDVAFVINTTTGRRSIEASFDIRRACTDYSIPCLTESDAAEAFVLALKKTHDGQVHVNPLSSLIGI